MYGGGNDPFDRMFGHFLDEEGPYLPPPPPPFHPRHPYQMHSQMREMDRMMQSMMDPFGMFGHPHMGMVGHPAMGMIDDGSQRRHPRHEVAARPGMGMFGFPDIFSQMNNLTHMAMNDPNSVCFTQSTMISMDPSGRHRVVEHSTRKSGDVREERRRVQNDGEEEMTIGHSIGDREHIMEKKRDKDGNVRRDQRFRNLDEAEAEAFDREFTSRAERNMRDSPLGGVFGYGSRPDRSAIQGSYGSGGSRSSPASRGAPIITLPDDDEMDGSHQRRTGSASASGPIIREISEEEAEQSIPKRRRDMNGRIFRGNEQ